MAFALQTQLVAHIKYGAAISAVVLSAVYIVLAFSMRSRTHPLAHWLTLSYAALALIFATLAVPLAVGMPEIKPVAALIASAGGRPVAE